MEVVSRQVGFKLCQDNLFKNFGEKWKIRDRPKVFFRSFTLSPGFFSRGLTMADLKQSGTMSVVREVFMILVMTGTRASRYCLVRDVGMGSSLQLFEAVFKISSSILASVTGSKSQNLEPVNGYKKTNKQKTKTTGGSAD